MGADIADVATETFPDVAVSRRGLPPGSSGEPTVAEDDNDLYASEPFYGPGSAMIANPASPYAIEQKIRPLRDAPEERQRHAIQHPLTVTNYNWAKAARSLQLDSSNLHKLAKKLGLK